MRSVFAKTKERTTTKSKLRRIIRSTLMLGCLLNSKWESDLAIAIQNTLSRVRLSKFSHMLAAQVVSVVRGYGNPTMQLGYIGYECSSVHLRGESVSKALVVLG